MEDTSLLFVDSNNRDTVLYPSGNSYTLHLTTPIRNITKVDLICAKVPNTSFNLQASSNLVINGSSNVVMLPGFYSTSSFCSEFNNSNQTTTKVNYSDAEGVFIFYSSTLSTIQASGQLANIIGFTNQTAFAASSNPVYTTSTVYSGMNLIKSPRIVNLTTNDYVWLDVEELRTPTSVDAKNIVNVNQTSNNITYSTVRSTIAPISAQTLPLTLDVPSQSGQTTIDLPVNLYGASVTNGYICTGAFGTAPVTQISKPPVSISWDFRASCTNKYGVYVLLVNATCLYSVDGITWFQTALPSSQVWTSVTASPITGAFVAVALDYDYAAYSNYGKTWISVNLKSSRRWSSISCSPTTGRFVAISGLYNPQNQAVYSDNGIDWTVITMPLNTCWTSITVNAVGRFVAVVGNIYLTGYQNTAYSDDGQNWHLITLSSPFNLASVTVNPTGRFVAVLNKDESGLATNQVIYSNNGRKWISSVMPSNQFWTCVTCSPLTGRFVAISSSTSIGAYSDDGISWIGITFPIAQMLTTISCNPITGTFLVVATNSIYKIYSKDGITWSLVQNTSNYLGKNPWTSIACSKTGNFVIGSSASEVSYSGDNGTNWESYPSYISKALSCSPVTNTYVSVTGGLYSSYSVDGKNWSTSTMPSDQLWGTVTCSAISGTFVTITGAPYLSPSTHTNKAAYSTTDGRSWVASIMPSSQYWTSVTCSPTTGTFVAVGAFTDAAYSATDGLSWVTSSPMPSSQYWNSVTCSPTTGTFVAVGAFTDAAYSATDGRSWVTSSPMPSSQYWNSVTCSPTTGTFVAVGGYYSHGYNKAVYSVNDGRNWIETSLPGIESWTAVTCNPKTGRFIAVNGGETFTSTNKAAYSDDGITWYPITIAATIAYSLPFAGYTTGTNFTFTPTIDSVTVDNTSSMKVGDSVQGYPDSKVTAISGNTVTFQVATPQSFPFIYVGSTFATYRSSNLSFQTYSSSTSSTSFAMIPMDVPSGYVKIFKENTDYGVSVTYPSRIDKLSRVTVRWLDNYGQPISFNTFDNNSFTLRIHSTRMVPEVERPLTLPAPVPLPKPQKMVAWISIAVLILGLLIITFMKNSIQ
jgi:hypothetical protein